MYVCKYGVCNLTLSDGPIDLRTIRIDSGGLIERATHRLQHSTHTHAQACVGDRAMSRNASVRERTHDRICHMDIPAQYLQV